MKKNIFQEILKDSLEKFNNRIAITYGNRSISYGMLNLRSSLIAQWLAENDLEKETFIGILLENRVDIISSIIAILKARHVFVPLDTASPQKRLETMIKTADIKWIITNELNAGRLKKDPRFQSDLTIICIDEIFSNNDQPVVSEKDHIEYNPKDKIYIYFTSGTTGMPKPIIGQNKSLAHFIQWEIDTFKLDNSFRFSQFINIGFDAFLRDVFVPLCSGGVICIPENKDEIPDPHWVKEWLGTSVINLIHCVPSFFRYLSSVDMSKNNFLALKYIMFSGEKIYSHDLEKWYDIFGGRIQLVNFYGSTETTMIKSYYLINESDLTRESIPIGKAMKGARIIILDKNMNPCDELEIGELYIRTPYRTLGYYNDPEANKRTFIINPFGKDPDDLLYKSGDCGRYLPDGNIELLGRMDRQMKIRGIRIELDGIESILGKHPNIHEAIVIKKERARSDDVLLAYITTKKETTDAEEKLISNIKIYLSHYLPGYMIPGHILILKKIPLTPNGKVDWSALPEPEINSKEEYRAPRNEIEKKLTEIWASILGYDKKAISIDANFFELGGHSLKATILASKVYREFSLKLPLAEIFRSPSVRLQSEYLLEKAPVKKFNFLERVEKKDYYILSAAQKRLFILQQLKLDSIVYNMPLAIQIEGKVDVEKTEATFKQLIRRHESFRTAFELIDNEPVQRIKNDGEFKLDFHETNKEDELKTIVNKFIRPFFLNQIPLLRVGLIKRKESLYILLLDMHHIISDGISLNIFIKEYLDLYSGHKLPRPEFHYKDYAEWQNKEERRGTLKEQETYWLKQFEGNLPVLNLPIDFIRPSKQNFEGSFINHKLNLEQFQAMKKMALDSKVTLYIIMLAIYNILLTKISGQKDIIVGTPVAGRQNPDVQKIIGDFVNILALRNYIDETKTFLEFLKDIKKNTLNAFDNQDYQFEDLVEKLALKRQPNRSPLFDVAFGFRTDGDGDQDFQELKIPGLKLKPYGPGRQISKYELFFNVFVSDSIYIKFEFSTKLFKHETINIFFGYIQKIIDAVLKDPRLKLSEIDISSGDIQNHFFDNLENE